MVRALAGLAVAAAVLMVVFSGGQDAPAGAQVCGDQGPFNFETHEAYDNAGAYLTAIELAAEGKAVTFATTPLGEAHGLEYPGLLQGTQEARAFQLPDPTLRIPPKLLKSVVWVESSFQQAHSDTPWGGVGYVVRSFDCGFGLGQITSGMLNTTGNPTAKQALVGTHFVFNLAEAARMLAEKWNASYVPIAGRGDPTSLEDWYYALWAYNGLAAVNHPLFQYTNEYDWINHPLHPWRDPLRGEVYHCKDELSPSWINAGDGTPVYDYGDYTYPERIYGCLRHPPEYPSRLYDDPLYRPAPDLEIVESGVPPASTPTPEPTPIPEETHSNEDEPPEPIEPEEVPEEGDGGGETPSETPETPETAPVEEGWPGGIPRMWRPVHVNMPDMNIAAVAASFTPSVFIDCERAAFPSGCPGQHFPASFPELGITTHRDLTPPVDSSLLGSLVGAPQLKVTAPESVAIAIGDDGEPESVGILVQNVGTWIAPYRILTSDPWILVRRSDDSRRLHGGVAMGVETTVVVYAPADITTQGHTASLAITLDLDYLPPEGGEGTVTIEPLLGGGAVTRIAVQAGPGIDTTTEVDLPDDEEEEEAIKYRVVIPGLASDEQRAD